MGTLRSGIAWIGALFTSSGFGSWIIATAGAVVSFLLPTNLTQNLAIFAACAVAVDTVTGIRVARKNGKPITSAGFGRVLDKGLGYGSIVAITAYINYVMPGFSGELLASVPFIDEFAPMIAGATHVPIVVVLLLITNKEVLSVLENIEALGVWMPPKVMPWIRKFLNKNDPTP